jgi:Mg-chelatase subunit ChlD
VADYAMPAVGIGLLPGGSMPITNSLAMQSPTGGSLPPQGLQGALQYAKAYAVSHPAEKVGVVLLTDGLPNICTNNTDSPADLLPIAQQFAMGSPPVVTYVIGIGNGVAPNPTLAQLNQIAMAGGTGTATLTNSAIEVQTALSSIRTQFKTCP